MRVVKLQIAGAEPTEPVTEVGQHSPEVDDPAVAAIGHPYGPVAGKCHALRSVQPRGIRGCEAGASTPRDAHLDDPIVECVGNVDLAARSDGDSLRMVELARAGTPGAIDREFPTARVI